MELSNVGETEAYCSWPYLLLDGTDSTGEGCGAPCDDHTLCGSPPLPGSCDGRDAGGTWRRDRSEVCGNGGGWLLARETQ